MKASDSIPLIGWGNRTKDDADCTMTLIDTNPLIKIVQTPHLEKSNWNAHLWWNRKVSLIGISVNEQSAVWKPQKARGYVTEVNYPTRFDGYCGFAVLPEPRGEFERVEKCRCISMPYSSASLEILLTISTAFTRLGLGPIELLQGTDY